MATKTEVKIQKLFSKLRSAGENEEFEEGLDISDEILKLAPDDPDASLCKLVCLIQLAEFQDALKLIERASKRAKTKSPPSIFEKAYCLYRQDRYALSMRTLDQVPADALDARVDDLRAQIHYRLEEYRTAAEMFLKGLSRDASQERQANFTAALAYCSPVVIQTMLDETTVDTGTMEQCFNLATAYLAVSHDPSMRKKAELLLQKAEELCSKSLDDDPDATEEDLALELVPVHVQLAYTRQLQGKGEEAISLYSSVLKQKPSNPTHSITSANNIIVLNRDKDIFDSKRKLKVLANDQSMKKLNSHQQLVVTFNRCQFALHTNQLEQCRQLLAHLKKKFAEEDLTVLAESSLLFREKKASECATVLEEHIHSKPTTSITLYLTLAQVFLSQNNVTKARQVLESIPGLPQYLGIVSTLVAQYTTAGDIGSAVRVLDATFDWWKVIKEDAGSAKREVKTKVLWEILQFKLRHGRPQEATKVLELLHKEEPSNVRYLATLISAYSRFDLKKAEELGRSLPRFTPPDSVDIDALEQMASFRHSRRQDKKVDQPPQQDTKKASEADTAIAEKKKKKRKPRIPKNADLSKPPDPERWLPLRERSNYRRVKKKSHATTVGRGTQGTSAATAAITAQLDASKPKASTSQEGEVPSPKPKSHPQKKQQQKKKKKGKR